MIASKAALARQSLVRRCAAPAAASSPSPSLRFQSSSSSSNNHPSKNSNNKPASLFDSAAETYSALRWKFATSLTSALSKDEQQELLGRLNVEPQKQQQQQQQQQHPTANSTAVINQEKEEKETQQHSIAEAVAAARAEEIKSQTAKWDKEKSRLLREAEEAAKARVENELLVQHRRLAFERWQKDLEQEDSLASSTSQVADTDDTTANDTSHSQQEQQQEQQPAAAVATETAEEPISISDHPVLGSAIADLGYKRVHIATVKALKSLPVWEKQRTYRHQRAKSMASDKLKSLHLGMPGIIALYEDAYGKLSIIDGQHRVGMMTILDETKEASKGTEADFFDLERILVEVYPETSTTTTGTTNQEANNSNSNNAASSHAQDIFLEINKAEPVKLVDLPGINLTKAGRKTINEGAKRLEEAYPDCFSASQRCRAPHLNIDNLRDALFASNVVKRHDLKSAKALATWMMEQNESLKKEYTSASSSSSGSTKAGSVSKTALAKAVKYDFFLGLDSSWLYA